MADEKKLYVLARFDDESEKRLSAMRNKVIDAGFVGGQTAGIPFHFTLCALSTDNEDELVKTVKSFEGAGRVAVDFSAIGNFGERVLFVTCPVSEELSKLQLNFGFDKWWMPHTTMYIAEEGGLEGAREVLKREFEPFKGEITSLMLYEFFPSRFITDVKL